MMAKYTYERVKWYGLIYLWTFALGVSLSYRPPAIGPVTPSQPMAWATYTTVLAGGPTVTGATGSFATEGAATAAEVRIVRAAALTSDTFTGTVVWCTDCGTGGSMMVKTGQAWKELR